MHIHSIAVPVRLGSFGRALVDKDEALDSLSAVGVEEVRTTDRSSDRMCEERHVRQAEASEELAKIGSKAHHAIAAGWLVGTAVSAPVHSDDAVVAAEGGELMLVLRNRLRPAREQHDWFSVASIEVGQLRPVGEREMTILVGRRVVPPYSFHW